MNNLLLEPRLSQIARGLAGMLAGVTAPPVSGTRYRDTYRALTAFVLWLTWRALAVLRLSRWQAALRQAKRRGAAAAAWRTYTAPALDVGLGVAALWLVPRWTGAPIPTLLWFAPDLSWWLVGTAILALGLAAAKTVIALRG